MLNKLKEKIDLIDSKLEEVFIDPKGVGQFIAAQLAEIDTGLLWKYYYELTEWEVACNNLRSDYQTVVKKSLETLAGTIPTAVAAPEYKQEEEKDKEEKELQYQISFQIDILRDIILPVNLIRHLKKTLEYSDLLIKTYAELTDWCLNYNEKVMDLISDALKYPDSPNGISLRQHCSFVLREEKEHGRGETEYFKHYEFFEMKQMDEWAQSIANAYIQEIKQKVEHNLVEAFKNYLLLCKDIGQCIVTAVGAIVIFIAPGPP